MGIQHSQNIETEKQNLLSCSVVYHWNKDMHDQINCSNVVTTEVEGWGFLVCFDA